MEKVINFLKRWLDVIKWSLIGLICPRQALEEMERVERAKRREKLLREVKEW